MRKVTQAKFYTYVSYARLKVNNSYSNHDFVLSVLFNNCFFLVRTTFLSYGSIHCHSTDKTSIIFNRKKKRKANCICLKEMPSIRSTKDNNKFKSRAKHVEKTDGEYIVNIRLVAHCLQCKEYV